jgi:two-component system, sensor histidine kinase and response regulator
MKSAEDLKVLLAEDNAVNQRLMMLLFNQLKVNVDIASDGKKAFEMYQQKAYDLIFMDVQMPVLNGVESTKLIREFERTSGSLNRALIIALSGSELLGNVDLCSEIGWDDFIEKPIRVEILHKHISKLTE